MCLNTSQARAKIAKTDITVYKTLNAKVDKTKVIGVFLGDTFRMGNPVKYTSRNQGFTYAFGKTYTGSLRRQYGDVQNGFHSFKLLSDARRDRAGRAVKCTIPKGSKYFEGFNNGSSLGYASNKIRIDGLI